jgi:aldose 1-epimerase
MTLSSLDSSSDGVELNAGALRLALRPDLGGCIAGLWLNGTPVLRSTEPASLAASRPSGSYPLVPYSNRIGQRRFSWQGVDYTTERNFDDNPHSVHGVGWLRPWQHVSVGDTEAVIRQRHVRDAHWPFDFEVEQRFVLTPSTFEVRMAFTNTDAREQPVGLGWHPYFPKRAASRLDIPVTGRWISGADQLPTHRVDQPGIVGPVRDFDFDNCFEGFGGAAKIQDEHFALRLTSSARYLVVYTPQNKDYYCVEPVTHLSNAVQDADPVAHGLVALAPGKTFEAWMKIEIGAL